MSSRSLSKTLWGLCEVALDSTSKSEAVEGVVKLLERTGIIEETLERAADLVLGDEDDDDKLKPTPQYHTHENEDQRVKLARTVSQQGFVHSAVSN